MGQITFFGSRNFSLSHWLSPPILCASLGKVVVFQSANAFSLSSQLAQSGRTGWSRGRGHMWALTAVLKQLGANNPRLI